MGAVHLIGLNRTRRKRAIGLTKSPGLVISQWPKGEFWIPLHDQDGRVRDWTVVDLKDSSFATSRWSYRKASGRDNAYAGRWIRSDRSREMTLLHNVIMNPPEGMEVDHENGNGLDNRRSNLRVVTHVTNMQNVRRLKLNKSSQFQGVTWDKHHRKWRARAVYEGRLVDLGRYGSEEEAGRVAHEYRLIHQVGYMPERFRAIGGR